MYKSSFVLVSMWGGRFKELCKCVICVFNMAWETKVNDFWIDADVMSRPFACVWDLDQDRPGGGELRPKQVYEIVTSRQPTLPLLVFIFYYFFYCSEEVIALNWPNKAHLICHQIIKQRPAIFWILRLSKQVWDLVNRPLNGLSGHLKTILPAIQDFIVVGPMSNRSSG